MQIPLNRFCCLPLFLLITGCNDIRQRPGTNSIISDCHKLKSITQAKHPVQPGEWRDVYTEIQEPLKFYLAKEPPKASARKSKLYVVQLGTFDAKGLAIFNDTKAYLSAFYQIPVAELKPIEIHVLPAFYIRENTFGKQIRTSIILDSLLPALMPDSAFALIAFSLNDLYPSDDWNFVFGEASLESGVGVWSMARLDDYHLNSELYNLCRQRTMNVAAHEIGHIFGITHCVQQECCMNGSNSLEESDKQPPWLCWECLAKVCMNRGVHPAAHIQSLLHFHKSITKDEKQIAYYSKALQLLK